MRFEVIPSRRWQRDDGACPWMSEAERDRWELVTVGWTIRDNRTGTVGTGQRPHPTRQAAEEQARRLNEACTMRKRTIYVQVVMPGEQYAPDGFTPWRNSTDGEQTAALAVMKCLREAGHMSRNNPERPVIACDAYWYPAGAPCYASGRPKTVQRVTFRCVPEEVTA